MTTVTVRRSLRAAVAAAALALLLAGCAPVAGEGPAPEGSSNGVPEAPAESGESGESGGLPAWATTPAQLVMAGQSFSFMTSCSVGEEDILIHGPGSDDDSGEPAYLSVDFTTVDGSRHGTVRIDLGTDQQFVSSDNIFVSNIGPDHEYMIMYNAGSTDIESQYLANGENPIGPATLTAECTQ
ncbi:MAG TPA: hypothetical protein PK781_11975 [Terrimesophilobacter sp.]|nr:hypothetical protein [Terrimesophilobacter sp.]